MQAARRTGTAAAAVSAAAAAGISWWYSSVLIDTRRYRLYPERVLKADGREVWLAESRLTAQPGTWGLRWAAGLATVGPVGERRPGVVVRPLLDGPVPPPGPAVMDTGPFDPDPGAHGLTFTEVPIAAPVGPCPAWLVPGPSGTSGDWVVMVHGKGGSRREALRVLPALHAAGLTALVLTYRNDVEEGAPAAPDGHDHLGDAEWADVETAVRYATAHGARRIVLFAWSMGAAITAALLDRSPVAADVVAVVWDAPLVDWRATLRQQARNRKLPPSLIRLVTSITSRRIDVDFDRLDLRNHPPAVRPPTLVVHSAQDTTVPPNPSRELAAAAADLRWPMRYVEVAGVEHTASWNADPAAYEQLVTGFLAEVL